MISLSNTSNKTGSIEMGQQSSPVVGLSILEMALILEHFHSVGNTALIDYICE